MTRATRTRSNARRAGTPQPPVEEVAGIEGTLEKIYTNSTNFGVMTNLVVDGVKYGLGSSKLPEDIMEGDIIAFDYKTKSKDGKTYKNIVAKTLVLIEEGPGESSQTASGSAGTGFSDDKFKSILMQVSYKAAAPAVAAAAAGGALKIPAKTQFDSFMDYIHKAADDIYLKLLNTDGFPTLEGQIVDSIDDDADIDDDLGDFDDE